MKEQILIKSEQYKLKKILIITIIIGVLVSLLWFLLLVSSNITDESYGYNSRYTKYLKHLEYDDCIYEGEGKCNSCRLIIEHPTPLEFGLWQTFDDNFDSYFILKQEWYLAFFASLLISGLIYIWLRSYELTVTDKRVYGKVALGKRVDLPVDNISAISILRVLKGVCVSTSSGKISFLVIKNADQIYEVINNLLIERQQKKENFTAPKCDNADELKKFKDLLDSGVITQEEFDAKKKQLLGL